MKVKFLLWLFVAIALTSCSGSSSKEESVKDEPTKESAEKGSSASTSSANETEKRIEELKKLPLITNDQMKTFFPEEVMGMKRSRFSVNSVTGFATGEAEYKKDDTTNYKVVMYDCAGEAGAGFYGMKFLSGWKQVPITLFGIIRELACLIKRRILFARASPTTIMTLFFTSISHT